jgi:hypothetical protein
VSRKLPMPYKRAFRFLGNAPDAEDAVQDALLSARSVTPRIRRLNRSRALGANVRLISGRSVKLNPRNFRCCSYATSLFVSFTLAPVPRPYKRSAAIRECYDGMTR